MELLDNTNCRFSVNAISIQDFTEENWNDFINLTQLIFKETYPEGDSPPSAEKIRKERLTAIDTYDYHYFMLYCEEEFLGYTLIHCSNSKSPNYELTKHIALLSIRIHPDHRRKGIATAVIGYMKGKFRYLDKTVMQGDVYLQSAVDFCKNVLKADPAKTGDENRVYLKDIDWDLMHSWIREDGDSRIEIYEDIPDSIIEELCEVYNKTLDREPFGELEEKFVLTPELQRKYEKQFAKNDKVIYTAVSFHEGKITGLTEMYYDQKEIQQISQGLTGVLLDYEGRGFGKWLKAALLLHVHDLFPDILFVRAGNASTNKPMLSINHRMGFRCIFHRYDYNIRLDESQAYA